MIYSGRKLVVGLAFSATSKYIEVVTSAGAEVGNAMLALGVEDRLVKMEECLKALTFLSSISDFAESFVVLLISQERIPGKILLCGGRLCRATVRPGSSWR